MKDDSIVTFLDKATEFLAKRDFYMAKAEFEKALAIDKNNLEALKGFGLCAFNFKDYVLAFENFEKALRISKNDATVLYYLTSLCILIEQPEDAITYAKKVISLRPDYFDAYKVLFTLYMKLQRSADIVALYKLFEKNNVESKDDTVFLVLGTLYMMKKQYLTAIGFFKKALKLSPKKEQIINNLGVCYMSVQDYDSAVNNFKYSLEINPNNHLTYADLGTVYQVKGDLLLALEAFNKSLELAPNNFLTLLNVANLSNVLRRYDLAIKSYEKLLQINPNLKEIQSSLIGAYAKNKQPEKAINLIDSSLAKSPRNVPLLFRKAKIYTDMGDFNAATKIYEQILSFKKNSPTIYHAFAVLYTKMKDYDKALQNLNKSITLDDKNAQAHKDLGVIYLMRNQVDYAKDEFDKAIVLGSEDNEILKECADFYYAISDFKKSQDLYQKSLKLEKNPFTSLSLGINLIAQNKLDEAFAILEPLLTVIPEEPELLYNLSRIYYAKQDFDMAARLAKKAYFKVPTVEIANILGLALKGSGEYAAAANIFNKIIDEYPHNAFVYNDAVECYKKQKDYNGLVDVYKKALKNLPYNEQRIFDLANALKNKGSFFEAKELLAKCSFEHPSPALSKFIAEFNQ